MNAVSYDQWMDHCLELAKRGAGSVSPNPMVGCVLLGPDGDVLGEGWHQNFGGPHAEVHAVREAEEKYGSESLRSATLVVNLEPCSYHGKTPPCSELIMEKGIPRVVVGAIDPNPRVAGDGIRRLREAGIDLTVGVREAACLRLNEAFIHHARTGRPLVIAKIAQTLDGCVATRTGDSRWASGEASRKRVHEWRAQYDAVLIGSGTASADDPALTVRAVEGPQPWRVVIDTAGRLPEGLTLWQDEFADRTIAVIGTGADPSYAGLVRKKGGRVIEAIASGRHLNLRDLFARLGAGADDEVPPMQSILVEPGPRLATALLRSDLIDLLHVFIAPKIVGDGGRSFEDLGVTQMNKAIGFAESSWEIIGRDILFNGYRNSTEDLRHRGE